MLARVQAAAMLWPQQYLLAWSCTVLPLKLLALAASEATLQVEGARWTLTTQQMPWVDKGVLRPGPPPSANESGTLEVLTDRELQEFHGFGACFNELGWLALQTISETSREEILGKLFDPSQMGLAYNRVPIGANDYANGWYSHDEMPYGQTDLHQEHFSIERDKQILIPYIRAAQKYLQKRASNSPTHLFASAWSPPEWMKLNHQYSACNRFLPFVSSSDPNTLNFTADVQRSYALYLSKFVDAYYSEGIHVSAVMVQNEPCDGGFCAPWLSYPKAFWTGKQMRDFIADYLGPRFAQDHGPTSESPCEVWLGTLNCKDFGAYPNTVLSDPAASKYVSGVAFQWDGKAAIGQTHRTWPHLDLIQSENECGDGENTWYYGMYVFDLIHHYFHNGARAYVYWNPVLGTEKGESHWGWKQNSMMTILEGRVTLNPEFYVMMHFSHFVQPPARHLGLRGDWADRAVAFRTTGVDREEQIVVVVCNREASPRDFTLTVEAVGFRVTLPPESFSTFVIPPAVLSERRLPENQFI